MRSVAADIAEDTRNPFRASIDAVFPFKLSNGQILCHAADHLVITALYINLMEQTFVPAVLSNALYNQGQTQKGNW